MTHKKQLAIPDSQIETLIDIQKDLLIAENLLNKSFILIDKNTHYSDSQKQELKKIIEILFQEALPYYKKGCKFSYIFHYMQTCYFMTKICLEEKLEYNELKNAIILAMLHDIGNADCYGPKITKNMIKEQLQETNIAKATELSKILINNYFEHMRKAEPIIRKVTQILVDNKFITNNDVDLIVSITKIHDYPSIELKYHELKELGIHLPYNLGEFLVEYDNTPFNRLRSLLREADKLFILSWTGILSELTQEKKEISLYSVEEKLNYNIQKFYSEYERYQVTQKDDNKFINQTLFRTKSGYKIFCKIKSPNQIYKKIKKTQKKSLINSEKLNQIYENIKSSFEISNKQMSEFLKYYIKEIELGLAGKSNYLKMLPTYLNYQMNQLKNKKSNDLFGIDFKTSSLSLVKMELPKKTNEQPETIIIKKFILDNNFKNIKSAEELFDILAKKIKNALEEGGYLNKSDLNLGLSFSYRFESINTNKGKIIELGKGYQVKDIKGKDPVELLEKALKENEVFNVKIKALANDAVTTLIAGKQFANCDIGMIIGTSTNIAFEVPTYFFVKTINNYPYEKMIVNMDSTSRFSYPSETFTTPYDEKIMDIKNKDGTNRIGKLITGTYIDHLFRIILKNSAEIQNPDHPLSQPSNVLAKLITGILLTNPLDQKKQINELFEKFELNIKVNNNEDAEILKEICHLIIKRSATLAALFIVGTIKFIDPDLQNSHAVAIDGALFKFNPFYRKYILETFERLNIKNIKLHEINNGTGMGAAILGGIR